MTQNYEVVIDGWKSSITMTAKKPTRRNSVFKTLGAAKERLLFFLRDERDEYRHTIRYIHGSTREDTIE